MGVIYGYVTGEYVTEESASFGDAEERGWCDYVGDPDLCESRNDVRPAVKFWEQHDELPDALRDDDWQDDVRELIASLGACEDNGDGTFYASDAVVLDYTEPGDYRYAVHFIRKDGDGEHSWHPSEAGVDLAGVIR